MVMPVRAGHAAWAGLAAGPGAWAVSTQANYALASWACAHGSSPLVILSLALAIIAGGGAFLSWFSWSGKAVRESEMQAALHPHPRPFLAAIGVFSGLLFALIILTQGAAALVLTGCER
jgi:hypothetical protein